jgi:murein L,D-transpeptidase YafK
MPFRSLICLLLFALPKASATEDPSLRTAVSAAGLNWPPPALYVEIDKSDRRLDLYSGSTLLKRYSVALGFTAQGDKAVEGDGKTPVGEFHVVTRNPNSAYYRFLGLSYPTTEDARRGLRDGLINRSQARRIREADVAKRQPPWNTALGGAIGIHGAGATGDWTLGCIALESRHMKEIWEISRMGMRVRIQE